MLVSTHLEQCFCNTIFLLLPIKFMYNIHNLKTSKWWRIKNFVSTNFVCFMSLNRCDIESICICICICICMKICFRVPEFSNWVKKDQISNGHDNAHFYNNEFYTLRWRTQAWKLCYFGQTFEPQNRIVYMTLSQQQLCHTSKISKFSESYFWCFSTQV